MWSYYELLTELQLPAIEAIKRDVASGTLHPMALKKDLARRIVTDFHSIPAATKAGEDWIHKDEAPDESPHDVSVEATPDGRVRLDKLVWLEGLADSASDAVRKIKQGGVKVNGAVVSEPAARLNFDETITLQVGKHRPRKLRPRLVTGIR